MGSLGRGGGGVGWGGGGVTEHAWDLNPRPHIYPKFKIALGQFFFFGHGILKAISSVVAHEKSFASSNSRTNFVPKYNPLIPDSGLCNLST